MGETLLRRRSIRALAGQISGLLSSGVGRAHRDCLLGGNEAGNRWLSPQSFGVPGVVRGCEGVFPLAAKGEIKPPPVPGGWP